MKTFLICPVRGHEMSETEEIVRELEVDFDVYWPPRDTNQNDPIGFEICKSNLNAIRNADVVHIIWDGKSMGSVFDLGMAFALGKPIVPIQLPEPTDGKSFQNMINKWKKQRNLIG